MILIALIAACILEKSDSWGPDGKLPLRAETVVSGLEVPWSFAFLPGGDVLVSERPGRVRLLQGGELLAQPVLAVKTGESSEGGRIRFGPDGALYVGTGDARQPERSQDPKSLNGKLRRAVGFHQQLRPPGRMRAGEGPDLENRAGVIYPESVSNTDVPWTR